MKNKIEAIAYFEKNHPEADVIGYPPENPTMFSCEVGRDEEKSVHIAAVHKSDPHYHSESDETTRVIEGEISLHVAGKQYLLREGESHTVFSGKVHSAISEEWAIVQITSRPPRDGGDHVSTSRRR